MHLDEKEKFEIIKKVVKKLAKRFRFGYHTTEDMEQEAYYFAYKQLPKWDGERSLYNFIYTVVLSRLDNYCRNNYMKKCPCKDCHGRKDGDTLHADKKYCSRYNDWYENNRKIGNIVSPIGISCMDEEGETNAFVPDNVSDKLSNQEIWELIDTHLPCEMRSTYLRMREGVTGVSEEEREKVLVTIRKILSLTE